MFGAIGRWFRSLGYLLTGRVDQARRGMDRDPAAVRARYDEVVREKTRTIQQYKQAVAGLIVQQEQKIEQVRALGEEVERLETLRAGALAKARQRVSQLKAQGVGKDGIEQDADYRTCLGGYNDFSSTLEEKQKRIAEAERDAEEYAKRIKEHTLQMQEAVKEIEKVKAEASDAVADIVSAQQERELADAVSGIGVADSSGEKLAELRRLRSEIRAEARVSKELAGGDTRLQEAEFLAYAREGMHNDEFAQLVGLAEETDAPAAERSTDERRDESALPE